ARALLHGHQPVPRVLEIRRRVQGDGPGGVRRASVPRRVSSHRGNQKWKWNGLSPWPPVLLAPAQGAGVDVAGRQPDTRPDPALFTSARGASWPDASNRDAARAEA